MTAAADHLVYALHASVEVLEAPDGRVHLVRPGVTEVVVPASATVDRQLLSALVEPGTMGKLAAAAGVGQAAVRDTLTAWEAAGVLTSWPAETQRRLDQATVALVGCGGLGPWALGALASAGVGSFVLVDDGCVDPDDLDRQALYVDVDADVGRAKVDCCADWVARFAPTVRVATLKQRIASAADVLPVARAADLIVLAADDPSHALERSVNAASVATATPYLACGPAGPVVRIGPLRVPGRTACFVCEGPTAGPLDAAEAGALGPAAAVAGTLLASEVVRTLLGRPAATDGRALLLDLDTLETRFAPVARDRRCAVCRTTAPVAACA